MTPTNLQSAWDHCLRSGRRSGLHHAGVEQILKLGPALLEAHSIGVGQVVGDIVDVGLLGGHTAGRAEQCSDHYCFPSG